MIVMAPIRQSITPPTWRRLMRTRSKTKDSMTMKTGIMACIRNALMATVCWSPM